jgi:hypothetical protein
MTNDMYRRLCEKRKREKRILDKRVKACYTVPTTTKERVR